MKKENTLDLTTGSITKSMIAFAIPVLLGNIFQLFYSLTDTRIVGSVLGESALASVGATSVLCNLVIGFMAGMALGFAIPVARCYGAKDYGVLKKLVGNIILFGLLLTIVLTAFFLIFMDPLLAWMNISKPLYDNAKIYMVIIVYGMFASFIYNATAGILRAVGDTIAPLLFLLLASVLNVLLDFGFICGFEMGVAGAALATVIAQVVAGVLCWVYMVRKYEMFRITLSDFMPDVSLMCELAKAGFSMAFMNSLVQFGTVALQTAINTLGQDIIVAHTAARKVTELFMMALAVMGSTMATFAGQNYGAGQYDRIRKGTGVALKICGVWCLIIAVVAQLWSRNLIFLVTGSHSSEVLHWGELYLRVDCILYMITAFICILRNMLQGVGDHITPVVSSMIELLGKVIFAKMMTPIFGYWGIIWSEPVVWAIMVIPLIVKTLRHPLLKKQKSH